VQSTTAANVQKGITNMSLNYDIEIATTKTTENIINFLRNEYDFLSFDVNNKTPNSYYLHDSNIFIGIIYLDSDEEFQLISRRVLGFETNIALSISIYYREHIDSALKMLGEITSKLLQEYDDDLGLMFNGYDIVICKRLHGRLYTNNLYDQESPIILELMKLHPEKINIEIPDLEDDE
jgi:hypothetical protein